MPAVRDPIAPVSPSPEPEPRAPSPGEGQEPIIPSDAAPIPSDDRGHASGAPSSGRDTRDRIVRAALGVFAAQGYDGTKTREIAEAADVNLGLLQYHFGGKQNLWRAAVDLAFAKLQAGLAAVIANDAASSDDDRLRLLIRDHVRFVARNPEFVRIMHDVGKRPGPRTEWLVETHVAPLYRGIVAIVERAGRTIHLPADLPPIHFHYILAGAVGLIFHQSEECRLLAGIDPFEEAHVERHARAIEYLLLGPPEEEPSRK